MDYNAHAALRLTNPSLPLSDFSTSPVGLAPVEQISGEHYTAGAPSSTHTYNGLTYVTHLDKVFELNMGGAGSSPVNPPMLLAMWLFDLNTNTWSRVCGKTPPNSSCTVVGVQPPTTNDNSQVAYASFDRMIYIHNRNYLYRLDLSNEHLVQVGKTYGDNLYVTPVVDPIRKRFIMIGNGTGFAGVAYYDLNYDHGLSDAALVGIITPVEQETSGNHTCEATAAPGLAYDPVQDRIVCWNGGNTVYLLNPTTWQWTSVTYDGGPAAAGLGTFGRFGHSTKDNLFVACNDMGVNCSTLRLTPSPTSSPSPAAPTNLQVE